MDHLYICLDFRQDKANRNVGLESAKVIVTNYNNKVLNISQIFIWYAKLEMITLIPSKINVTSYNSVDFYMVSLKRGLWYT